jgi:quinol monooxygenase YgiN
MAYVVIAIWVAKEGEEEAVADAISALAGPSREEPGNLVYEPHRSREDPRTFVVYEKFVDEDAYRAHGDSEHFRRFGLAEGIPRLEHRERLFLTDWEG